MTTSENAVRASAAWAAYGDALGFITELTDADGVRRRVGKSRVTTTVGWKRRIGGQFGVTAELPPGAYSDDTQLRLATGRAIRADGDFDVTAFARVELPSWLAYALGGGRGSKTAASAMTRAEATWSANVFTAGKVKYVEVGGNGAAMRVQPHVWASRDVADSRTYTLDVVRNAVVSHGHPRGIYGAVLHARTLATVLETGEPAHPKVWEQLAAELDDVYKLIEDDQDLSNFWLPAWERAANRSFKAAADDTVAEVRELSRRCADAAISAPKDVEEHYTRLLTDEGGLDDATRGSATLTAAAATLVAYLWREDPERGLVSCVNVIGSDTDTIGTMAGALVGAVVCKPAPGRLQDAEVIDAEARRLWATGARRAEASFRYPDLLRYHPPRAGVDLVGTVANDTLALSGLGPLSELGPTTAAPGKAETVYQWVTAATGQRMFIRRRETPRPLPADALAKAPLRTTSSGQKRTATDSEAQPSLFDRESPSDRSQHRPPSASVQLSLEEAVEVALQSKLDPVVVGRMLLSQIRGGRFDADRAAAFAGLLVRLARNSSPPVSSDTDDVGPR